MLHLQIPVKAPDTARGELEITYLDEELRWVAFYSRMFINCIRPCVPHLNFKLVYFHHVFILSHFDRVSRGDKGNLFILKMIDPSYRVPAWYAVSLSLYTIYIDSALLPLCFLPFKGFKLPSELSEIGTYTSKPMCNHYSRQANLKHFGTVLYVQSF
jgi:hypothetical protein